MRGNLAQTKKCKRLGYLKDCDRVSRIDISLIFAEVEFHYLAGLRREVDVLEVDPEGVWREC